MKKLPRKSRVTAVTGGTRRIVVAQRSLVIDAGDSAEEWRGLIESIEELAERGEFIDCSLRPIGHDHLSTPLRRATDERAPQHREEGPESTEGQLVPGGAATTLVA